MKNGRLRNDFMRNLSSHHKVADKVADDHQVLSVTTQRTKCIKSESCNHLAKRKIATTHMDPLEDYQLICFSPFCQ